MILEFWVLLLAVTVFLSVLGLLFISGLGTNISIAAKKPPLIADGFVFVFKLHHGTGSDTGYIYNELYSLDPNRLQCCIQYTEDGELSTKHTRTAAGVILPASENEEAYKKFRKAGFTVSPLPAISEALVASFPHTSFLSIPLSTWRVYPALMSYATEHKLPLRTFIEIYTGEEIHFIALLRDDNLFDVTNTSTDGEVNGIPLDGSTEAPADSYISGVRTEIADMELEASFEKVSLASLTDETVF